MKDEIETFDTAKVMATGGGVVYSRNRTYAMVADSNPTNFVNRVEDVIKRDGFSCLGNVSVIYDYDNKVFWHFQSLTK